MRGTYYSKIIGSAAIKNIRQKYLPKKCNNMVIMQVSSLFCDFCRKSGHIYKKIYAHLHKMICSLNFQVSMSNVRSSLLKSMYFIVSATLTIEYNWKLIAFNVSLISASITVRVEWESKPTWNQK